MSGNGKVLLIHPPLYDFTAFDFYLYPLGLVHLADDLIARGYEVELIDALDRFHPTPPTHGMKPPTFRKDGCGHFHRVRIPAPEPLAAVPRRFHRFGLPRDVLEERLKRTGRPLAAAVTCSMTYWYPGVIEAMGTIRGLWPTVPVILGGAYATLCPEHAETYAGADFVHQGREIEPLAKFLSKQGHNVKESKNSTAGHDLVGERPSAAVQASFGCPKRCPYCASFLLCGPYRRRPVEEVLEEISFLIREKKRSHIAFYDDALLDDEEDFLALTEGLMTAGLHERAAFHCPNAVSASTLTESVARALKACNFHTLRIGFETSDPHLQRELGGKATNQDLEEGIGNLRRAGFDAGDLGVYILAGLPEQEREGIEASIRFVRSCGAPSRLAEYAPVPGTPLFEKAKELSRLDLEEPLHHNKTLAPFRFPTLDLDGLRRLKDLSRELNEDLLA